MSGESQMTSAELAGLIGSRICHDLISPVGAIGNGVEMLSMTGTVGGPELALISESVENANARIRFFRIAFGQASDAQAIGRPEILSILTDMYKGARLKVHWAPDGDCARRDVQLAFLLLLCLETAMPYGGQVHISRTDTVWAIQGDADKMKHDSDLWGILEGAPAPRLIANHVHFAMVLPTVDDLGRRLTVETHPSRIIVRV